MSEPARVAFVVKLPADGEPGKFRFVPVQGHRLDRHGDGHLHTEHPPSTGDLVWVHGDTEETQGSFRVVDRCWTYSQHGSANWPHGIETPWYGHKVTAFLVPEIGPYADETRGDGIES